MVIELPPGSFIGFATDHNQRYVLDMGLNGPDKGQGGKYLILPPDYQRNNVSSFDRIRTWQPPGVEVATR
jgi:hypothetical protein